MASLDPEKPFEVDDQSCWDWRKDVLNGYAHSTSRANQLLATDWGALTTIDVRAIKENVAERLAKASDIHEVEAALLVLGILTTGRSAAAWLRSRVVPVFSGLDGEIVLQDRSPGWRWLLPVQASNLHDERAPDELLIQPVSHVDLACVPLMKSALRLCFRKRFNTFKLPVRPFSLFSTSSFFPEEQERKERLVRASAASLIRQRPAARSSTLTLQSLERWFWAAMARTEAGDPASTCRLTSRKEHPYRAQLHYGVLSRAAASKLQFRTLAPAGLVEPTSPQTLPKGDIGSRRTPTAALISRFAALSSKSVLSARKSRDRTRLHNALTLHTAAVIMLSMGLRPAKRARIHFRADDGLALVFDKFVDDARVRPVPIGQLCREQIAFYAAHLAADGLTTGASAGDNTHPELPFAIIDGRGRARRTSLAVCWRLALRSFSSGLPFNIQRHFLRTSLVGSASAESIDALLGHWVVGTEPWGRFSGLDPLVYAADIRPIVDDVLSKAGWRTEHGLASTIPVHLSQASSTIGQSLQQQGRTLGAGLRSEPSPFNWAFERPDQCGLISSLSDWLESAPADTEASLGQILASAMVNGALLDPKWFPSFLRALERVPLSRSRLCVEMEPADVGDTRHVYAYSRRWFCDPITDLLIRRWRVDRVAARQQVTSSAHACFGAFFAWKKLPRGPGTLNRLLAEATVKWRLTMPGLLVSYATGEGPSLSLPVTTWDRIVCGKRIAAEKPAARTPTFTNKPRRDRPAHYLSLMRALKSAGPNEKVRDLFRHLRDRDDRLVAHLVRWAALAIGPRGKRPEGRREWGQKQPYSPGGTVWKYARAIGNLLADELESDLRDIDAALLDELYRRGLEEIDDANERNVALNAVYSFQAHLCSGNPELDVGYTYGDLREEGRVSINAISSEDYRRALQQVPGLGRDERMLRLVLTLAFRTGLRLPEILGLRHVDLAAATDPSSGTQFFELFVRPYGSHLLKTQQSRRMIPLDVLMTSGELQELQTWCEDHEEEACKRPFGLLFTHAGGGSGRPIAQRVRQRLVDALIRATGDKGMRFEHLRHSFATQLLACLLLPRDGSHLPIPAGFDADSMSEGRRDRIIARISGSERPGRSALHIVSQMCGHGPVTTTLRWYVHMLDWSVGAFANRTSLQPHIPRPAALAIMQRTKKEYRWETLSRADHRHRTSLQRAERQRGCWEDYRTPRPLPDVCWADEDVPLLAVHKSLRRRLDCLSADKSLPRHRPLRRLQAPRLRKPSEALPTWRAIRTAVLSLRAGAMPREVAEPIGVTIEAVIRWWRMADLIAGPRRQGEEHMRFEPKMSSARRAKFDLVEWRRTFPSEPRGRDALDLVDHIWRVAEGVHGDADVRWALEEFCRYHSVDTGCTTFLKRKDAQRFYRGMAKIGFANALSVLHLDKRKRSPNCRAVEQSGACSCGCDQLRWRLAKALPQALRPSEPKVIALQKDRFPRVVAIYVGLPSVPGRWRHDQVKLNNHTRSAIRFALTMLAIGTLDNIREPARRRGWRPSYGGYY